MAPSHTWHPGAVGINPFGARMVPIQPDELLSSWLVRASLSHGCDPLVLTGYVWPRWRAWTVDVDQTVTSERLATLARLSGIPADIFKAATLQPVTTGICGASPSPKSVRPWILTLGARNLKRNGGLQYCPECLSADRDPYFRLQWRLAWHTGCQRHGKSLLDRCWNCKAPLEPHRLIAEDGHVAICATCRADLRAASGDSWLSSARGFQLTADQILQERAGVALGRLHTASEWFDLVGYLVSLVRQASYRRSGALQSMVESVTSNRLPEPFLSVGTGIEGIPIATRQALLGTVTSIFAGDGITLRGACLSAGVSSQGLCGARKSVPPLILELAESLPHTPRGNPARSIKPRTSGPRPRHVVERMMARLVRLARQGRP